MDIISQFREPDRKYSVLAFWFLSGKLEEEKLRWQIDEMVDKGVYGGFMHPRAYLETPYLEQEWWDAIDACVDEARKTGFSAWIYDEYAWPSGTAGSTFEYGFQKPSRTLAMGRENMAKGLYAKRFITEEEVKRDRNTDDCLIKIQRKDGIVYGFYCRTYEKAVDYLNPDTIKLFIQMTHEEYKKRFGDGFGKWIPGIFFDEIFMAGNPLPWTDRLPEVFLGRYGYDLMEELPCLVDGDGEHERRVRKDYFALAASMYEEAFFGQLSHWCQENQLQLTGHTEEFLWEHPRKQGNYFRTMRHLMIPGADCHDYRYRYPRKITFCEPKYAVSVARAYGKERAMSEALGEDVYHYHLHVVYIPVVEKEIRWTKRCKDKSLVGKVKETVMQVSMSKKWASQPAVDEATGEPLRTAKGKPVLRKSYSVLQDDFFKQMRSAGYTDLERGERGSSEEHLTVTQFKVKCEQERLAQLQEAAVLAQAEVDRKNREAAAAEKKAAQAKAKLNDVAPMLKGMEKLAEEFSSDPEQVLPEAGPLESARAYREKKAKPLWAKIVKVLRSVYRAYFDLKSKFERLQSAYDREVSKNGSLSARIYEVCAERDGLKGQVRDYERVRRAIGPEQADRILEAAYQQEQVEKEQKWGARSKIRVGAR